MTKFADHDAYTATAPVAFQPLLACLIALSFIVTSRGTVIGVHPDDHKVPREMVGLIRKKEADSFARGKELFRSMADARTRPVACQALALLAIQAGGYSDAWRALSSTSKLPESGSMQAGHDRILLWLLLESHSSERAASHFKKLVTLTINAKSGTKEIVETAGFLGGVVAMLESQGESSDVSAADLSKARTALEGLKNDAAVQCFKASYDSASSWADSLESCRDEVRKLGTDQRAERATSVAQRLADARVEQAKQTVEVRHLRQERRKLEQLEEQYKRNWNPNLGMPQIPRRPEKDRDERDNAFDKRVAAYERDVLTYRQRLADWEVVKRSRQEFFEGQLRAGRKKLAEADAQLTTAQESEKKFGDLVQTLSKEALLLQRVRAVLESNAEKDKNLFQPSCFDLLDFDQEATRLESCLRQLK